METYTTLTNETIEYDAQEPSVAAFLARVRSATNDPDVTESALTELIYGSENPILDHTIFPHRGAVTKAVFGNPLYHVMLDLLDQKRVQVGTLDLELAKADYTVTVAEAAEKLGITPGAIRYAIKAQKLSAIKNGGVWLIHPNSVNSYQVSLRGPKRKP